MTSLPMPQTAPLPFSSFAPPIHPSSPLRAAITDTYRRPELESLLDGQSYLQHAISPEHFRELRRQCNDQFGVTVAAGVDDFVSSSLCICR